MSRIKVLKLTEEMFDVRISTFNYKVTVSKDYWQKLTGGKIPPEQLVAESFAFLLEREGPESILKEFDLSLISRYFPDYENTVRQGV